MEPEILTGPGWALHCGDALTVLRGMEEGSVNCCVTSPPYWGLRRYLPEESAERQHELGSEKGLDCLGWVTGERCGECYVCRLVEVFQEVRRVLRGDGTCWVNLADSYAGSGRAGKNPEYHARHTMFGKAGHDSGKFGLPSPVPEGLKPKDVCGVPWRVALALQAEGWWLRSDIIWAKGASFGSYVGNPMPESVTDRPVRAHEYVFLLTKSARYWYDAFAIRERAVPSTAKRLAQSGLDRQEGGYKAEAYQEDFPGRKKRDRRPADILRALRDNGDGCHSARSVWTIPTEAFPGAHFATFPRALVRPMVRAGCPALTCVACSKPWRRVTKRTKEPDASAKGSRFDKGKTGGRDGGDRTQPGQRYAKEALGWSPTCSCHAPTIRGTVLDPFAGAGTSLLVAIEEGRRAVGIELNPDYVKLASARCASARLPLFADSVCADEGETVPDCEKKE